MAASKAGEEGLARRGGVRARFRAGTSRQRGRSLPRPRARSCPRRAAGQGVGAELVRARRAGREVGRLEVRTKVDPVALGAAKSVIRSKPEVDRRRRSAPAARSKSKTSARVPPDRMSLPSPPSMRVVARAPEELVAELVADQRVGGVRRLDHLDLGERLEAVAAGHVRCRRRRDRPRCLAQRAIVDGVDARAAAQVLMPAPPSSVSLPRRPRARRCRRGRRAGRRRRRRKGRSGLRRRRACRRAASRSGSRPSVKVSSTPPAMPRPVLTSAVTAKADSCQLAASTPSPPLKWSRPVPLTRMSLSAPPNSTSSPPLVRVGEEDVVAGVAVDDVLARAAADHVVAAVAGQPVVAAVAEDLVGERGAVDDVARSWCR